VGFRIKHFAFGEFFEQALCVAGFSLGGVVFSNVIRRFSIENCNVMVKGRKKVAIRKFEI